MSLCSDLSVLWTTRFFLRQTWMLDMQSHWFHLSAEHVMGNHVKWCLSPQSHPHTPLSFRLHTTQVHTKVPIWSAFVPTLQWWKSRYPQNTSGTVFLQRAVSLQLCNHQHNHHVSLHKVPFWVTFAVWWNSQFVLASRTLQFSRWQSFCRHLPFIWRNKDTVTSCERIE